MLECYYLVLLFMLSVENSGNRSCVYRAISKDHQKSSISAFVANLKDALLLMGSFMKFLITGCLIPNLLKGLQNFSTNLIIAYSLVDLRRAILHANSSSYRSYKVWG